LHFGFCVLHYCGGFGNIKIMAQIDELIKNRQEKLARIKKSGINPYPITFKRNFLTAKALANFKKLSFEQKEITLAGRIRSLRGHGGLMFFDIEDDSGKIQALLKKNGVGEIAYNFFIDNFDIGDFVEVRGVLFETNRGEKTIEIRDYKILAKNLRPLPEKWHGLVDMEERFRKRYLDLIFNPEIKKKFELRSKIIKTIRDFLGKQGFLEVETPILQTIYGGAKAEPFKTKLNALDMELFLRIAPELYLKRLLVGGWEKVYEIGKQFRNEGMDRNHNPEFTTLEFYWAYADYKQLMRFTEKMFSEILKKVFGGLKIIYQGKEIDFKPPWPRIEFETLLRKYAGVDYKSFNLDALKKTAKKLNVVFNGNEGKAEIADAIYKKYCREKILTPTFVIHHPYGFFPLAKQLEKNPENLANFQVVISGWEIINAFSEQNDPIEQKKIFKEQEILFKQGFKEAQRTDEDFLEALEYGMPPAAGFGMGIDRIVALLTDSYSLRDIILFPTMRPR